MLLLWRRVRWRPGCLSLGTAGDRSDPANTQKPGRCDGAAPLPALLAGCTPEERLSLMGLRVGCLEAYARELYRERSTSLFHLRAAANACGDNVKHHLA